MTVDWRELAGRYSFAEHATRADGYYASISTDSAVARKPFASVVEAVEILTGLSVLLRGLHLFQGARVLDFGAGTCWLSRELAKLGASVVAADVSREALEVGSRLIREDPVGAHLDVSFVQLVDGRLPFEDASFDRVVCFDAFHHSPDQNGTLREFARILRDGGVAAFHEPGPTHSQSERAQYEMRAYNVIEGDIVVEELFEVAAAVGFTKLELAVYGSEPMMTDLAGFNRFMKRPAAGHADRTLAGYAQAELANRRTFFLHKGDLASHRDSRSEVELRADFALSARVEGSAILVEGSVANSGGTTWLPSSAPLGPVNIGVHLIDADGVAPDNDYLRVALADTITRPGESRPVAFSIPIPAGLRGCTFVVDLVAERVAWFELRGSTAVRLRCTVDPVGGRVSLD